MRKPLGRFQVLLLQRRIQDAQSPYFARRRRVVALDVCFGFAVRGLQGEGAGSLLSIEENLSADAFHFFLPVDRSLGALENRDLVTREGGRVWAKGVAIDNRM